VARNEVVIMRNFRSSARRSLSFLAFGALSALAPAAAASEEYPGKIQSTLGLECAPPCTMCHDNPLGGLGTVRTKFGLAIRGTGPLDCCSPDSIPAALAALSQPSCTPSPGGVPVAGAPCDSDGDGVPDIEELQAGRDPNAGGADFCSGPRYGCGAHIAPASGGIDWVSLVIAGATAAVLARSMRRARKPR
jgi:hypothetical protein